MCKWKVYRKEKGIMDIKDGMKQAKEQHGNRGGVKGMMEGNEKIDDIEKRNL